MRWMRSKHRNSPIAGGTAPDNFGMAAAGTRLATKPLFAAELSDVNVTVRELLVDVTGAGTVMPEKLPNEVELVDAPSYSLT